MWSTTRLPSSGCPVVGRFWLLGVVLCVTVNAPIALGQQPAAAPSSDHFGRMFNNLPPFAPQNAKVTEALIELGKPGGLMDAKDNMAAGPIALIVDPLLNLNNPNNDTHTAGVTFMGQFLDHDMTFDTSSRLGQPANPRTSPNSRRPYFDLDSVYGDGPVGSPLLYEPDDRAKLRIESNGPFEDLPRDVNGTAVIADPRNDENLVISGLQAAFLLFHNRVVDLVRDEHPAWEYDEVYRVARRADDLALPVDHSSRDPARIRWDGHGGRRPQKWVPLLSTRKWQSLHSGRVSDGLSLWAQHGAAVLSRELHRKRRRSVLCDAVRGPDWQR